MKQNKETTCTPCEETFERQVDDLVREGKAPTPKERMEKEKEVKAAFTEHGKEKK